MSSCEGQAWTHQGCLSGTGSGCCWWSVESDARLYFYLQNLEQIPLFGSALNWNKAETGRRQSPVTLKHRQVGSDVIQVNIFYYFGVHLFFF